MKTFCVFQACDKHGLNRLVDRITSNVKDGIDRYKSWTRGEVLFIPNGFSSDEDVPEHVHFLEPDLLTPSDIDWLRNNQDYYGSSMIDHIQDCADTGRLGIFRGICVRVHDDEVFVKHLFLIELRHVYDV